MSGAASARALDPTSLAELVMRRLDLPTEPAADADLISLGASSLVLALLARDIRAAIGRPVPLHAIFADPTPRGLLRIAGDASPDGDEVVVRPDVDPDQRLLSLQQRARAELVASRGPTSNNLLGLAFDGRGALAVDALRDAVRDVVDKHEVLRTVLDTRSMTGRVLPARSVDLRVLTATRGDEAVVTDFLRAPLDVTADPPIRFLLVQWDDDGYTFAVSVEHLAFDRQSAAVLLEDLATAYAFRLSPGSAESLAPLPFQYGDFAHAQLERRSSAAWQDALPFWAAALAGTGPFPPAPIPPLPGRGSGETGPAAAVRHSCDAAHAVAAVDGLEARGATVFDGVLAALRLVFERSVGSSLPGLVTTYRGRDLLGTENLIGWFADLVPITFAPDGQDVDVDAVASAQRAARSAFAHAGVPLSEVVRTLFPDQYGKMPTECYVFLDVVDTRSFSGRWVTGSVTWTQGAYGAGSAVRIHPGISIQVELSDDGLGVDISYADGVLDGSLVDSLAHDVVECFLSLGERAETSRNPGGRPDEAPSTVDRLA